MARTNAFVCDRCGKAAKKNERYQIRTRWYLSWASNWNNPIDLCEECWFEFQMFMQSDETKPVVLAASARASARAGSGG